MVVDDNAVLRELTVTALMYCVNREVRSFENGRTAWEYIESGGEADMILSDGDMPEMNGFELLTRVKEKYPGRIVVIMSGNPENEKKARLAGADAFLAKPFGIRDLFGIVQCFVVDGVN